MVQESTAIAYPYPDLASGQDAGWVRPARWRAPQLPHVFQHGPRRRRAPLCVCAGHSPATAGC